MLIFAEHEWRQEISRALNRFLTINYNQDKFLHSIFSHRDKEVIEIRLG